MKKLSKNILLAVTMTLIISSSFAACAANTSADTAQKGKPDFANAEDLKDKEMVVGKIKEITADKVVIEVATRKIKSKDDAEKKADKDKQEKKEMPKAEDMYTLTGESKTYDIKSANLGMKMPENPSTEDKDKKEMPKGEQLTYADYKVGDYVRITVDKDTPLVAKRMSSVNRGFDFRPGMKPGEKP